MQWWQRIPTKKFAACSEFLFCLFSHFHGYCGCTELASSITMQHNSWYGMILLEKQMKGATKLTSKLWIHENHICELWSEELNEGWSSSSENHAETHPCQIHYRHASFSSILSVIIFPQLMQPVKWKWLYAIDLKQTSHLMQNKIQLDCPYLWPSLTSHSSCHYAQLVT